jgi:hypothetical protein
MIIRINLYGNTKFQSKNLKGRDHLGNLGINGRIILKVDLKEIGCEDVYITFNACYY